MNSSHVTVHLPNGEHHQLQFYYTWIDNKLEVTMDYKDLGNFLIRTGSSNLEELNMNLSLEYEDQYGNKQTIPLPLPQEVLQASPQMLYEMHIQKRG